MTHRILAVYGSVGGSVKGISGKTGTSLSALVIPDEIPLMALPEEHCSPRFQHSIRGIDGTVQSQNSDTVGYAQGYVKVQGLAVSRPVAVYRRDTKALLVKGTSDASGFFRLSWKGYSGKIAVVVFDDEAVGYNAKVLDLIVTN